MALDPSLAGTERLRCAFGEDYIPLFIEDRLTQKLNLVEIPVELC